MNEHSWFERDHVAIITGASKGFGRAVAGELARRGIALVITARDAEALEHVAVELRGGGGTVVALAGDVTDGAHVHRLVAAADERFGRIDLVINNASSLGRTPLPPLRSLSPAAFERAYATNVYAPLHLIQHALPIMERRDGGTIVNVSSDAAQNAYAGWGGYGSAKAALEQLSRILAQELAESRVSVLVVDPGDMNTDLHRAALPDDDASTLADPRAVAPLLMRALAAPRGTFARVVLQETAVTA